MRRRFAPFAVLVAIVLFIFAVIAAAHFVFSGGGHKPHAFTKTIGKKADPQAPVVTIDPGMQLGPKEKAQDATAPAALPAEGPGVHEDMRDETPPGVKAGAAHKIATSPMEGIGPPLPSGGAQTYSCRQHFVVNSSTRSFGTKVGLEVIHYTVSRPGSLNAIWGLFNTPSFGASSHLLLEPTGRCEQIVPWDRKAWTQLTFNSVSESIEIMAMGTEPRSWWLAQPILKKGILAAILSDRLRARGLPPDHVDPVGCGVQHAGWTDHNALECGNTHHDVTPNFPYDVLERQIKRAYYGGNPMPLRCTTRNIEKLLNRRYPEMGIRVDGKIGNRSRAAVRRFQHGNHLRADGIVGPITGRRLGLEGCVAA